MSETGVPPGGPRGLESMTRIAFPYFLGAAFKNSDVSGQVRDYMTGMELRPLLNVQDPIDRRRWLFLNLAAFNDEMMVSHREEKWKGAVTDYHRPDLRSAAKKAGLASRELKGLDLDLRAAYAVTGSARAMEFSDGDFKKYLLCVGGRDPKTQKPSADAQDTEKSLILHGSPEKLNRVIRMPLVERYYKRLLADAGLTDVREWSGKTASTFNINMERALGSQLVDYLKDKAERGGFDDYASDFLLQSESDGERRLLLEQGYDDECRWAAARLACDAFLVDKYTEWEYRVNSHSLSQGGGGVNLNLQPLEDWGGSPFTNLYRPSFLPRDIKRVYPGGGILDLVDEAIKPEEIFAQAGIAPVPHSAVGNLKAQNRMDDVLWNLIGTPQADGLAVWGDQTAALDANAGLLNQVYGNEPHGKEVIAYMLARMIQVKTYAAIQEVREMGVGWVAKRVAGDDKQTRVFFQPLDAIWGAPRYRTEHGLIRKWMGKKYGLVFWQNPYGAEQIIQSSFNALYTTDATADGAEKKAKIEHFLEQFMQISAAVAEHSRYTK